MESPALTQSILAVSTVLAEARTPEPSVAGSEFDSQAAELVFPVQAVASAFGRIPKPTPKESKERPLPDSIREVSRKIIDLGIPGLAKEGPSFPFLRTLGRQHDENLHSSFLAALLTESAVGQLAKEFLCALWTHAEVTVPFDGAKIAGQVGWRERRLDSIAAAVDPNIAARRIDILIETDRAVMAIENKVMSSESVDQTNDYYNVVGEQFKDRHTCFLFLSPGGMAADNENFRPIRFEDIFSILNGLARSTSLNPFAKHLLDIYLAELFEIFIQPRQRSLERAANDLRKAQNGIET
jgi:hypothetical protein